MPAYHTQHYFKSQRDTKQQPVNVCANQVPGKRVMTSLEIVKENVSNRIRN